MIVPVRLVQYAEKSLGICRTLGQALVLQGPPGSGKTATLQHLARLARGPMLWIEPWPKMGYGSLVRALLRALGVPPTVDFLENLERLKVRLHTLAQTHGRMLLMIDNAELMSARQWRTVWALFTLHVEGEECGPIPVVATRREKIDGELHKYETLKLQPWDANDIQAFVTARLGEWPDGLEMPRQAWASEVCSRLSRWCLYGRRRTQAAAAAGGGA